MNKNVIKEERIFLLYVTPNTPGLFLQFYILNSSKLQKKNTIKFYINNISACFIFG